MWDTTILDNVLAAFQAAYANYSGLILILATSLLMITLVYQFAAVIAMALVNHDLTNLTGSVALAICRYGIVIIIFRSGNAAGSIAQSVIDTGVWIGQQITGLSPLTTTPSGIFGAGVQLGNTIINLIGWAGWFTHPLQITVILLLALVIIAVFFYAALLFLLTLIEAAGLVTLGPLVICWTLLPFTTELIILWAKALLALAIRIAVLLIVLAVSAPLIQTWTAELSAASATYGDMLVDTAVGALVSLIFFYVVKHLPVAMGSFFSGATATFISAALGGLAAGAAAIGSAAAVASGAVAGGAQAGGGTLASSSKEVFSSGGGSASQAVTSALSGVQQATP